MESALAEQVDPDLFTGYPVKIEIFQGPIDLLVYLVRREQLDIAAIALAQVTGQYLEYLRAMQAVNIEVAGEFLVTAATLLQIKARRLLPATAASRDEEDEEALALVDRMQRRVAEYRTFKDAAMLLEDARQLRRQIFVRSLGGDSQLPSGFVRLEDVSIFDLVGAVRDLLSKAAAEPLHTVERPAVSLSERIEDVLFQLRAAGTRLLTFAELVGVPVTRQMVIVTFLAVLELIRQRRLRVRQEALRGEILVGLLPEKGT